LISSFYYLLFIFPSKNTHYRTKNLLFGNSHIVLYISKNSGFNKIPFAADSFTTTSKFCSTFFTLFNIIHYPIKLLFRYNSTLHWRFVHWMSNLNRLSSFDCTFDKFIINWFVNKCSWTCDTTLSSVSKNNACLITCLIKICIRHNYIGRFSS